MKKIYLAFLLLFAGMVSLNAQTYHPLVEEGKLWTTYHLFIPFEPPISDYTKFEGDTMIGAFTYKRVWVTRDSSMNTWQDYGIIREDAQKKVFYSFTDPSHEFLLYDFNAAVGDTLYLHGNTDPYVVDSIGTFTLVSGEQRKSIMLHFTMYNCTETWVEGIGCITYGVLNGGFCGLVGDNPKMICEWENDTIKYHWDQYPDCFIYTGINDLSEDVENIRVFPNPASDALTIEVKQVVHSSLRIEIIELTGKISLESELNAGTTHLRLEKNALPGGIYLYRIHSVKEILKSGKLTIL